MPHTEPGSEGIPEFASCGGARWVLNGDHLEAPKVRQLAAQLDLPEWFASLLVQRGINSRAEADRYLQPSLDQLHDPLAMLGAAAAVDRILRAIRDREPILIYGDYDVDGTVATVLLKTAIDRLAPEGEPSLVRYHIPHRIREGYGMQGKVLAGAAESGIRLVISVDTGIRAFAAAEEARDAGLDLIVTDHHLPDGAALPEALAVINPNQPGCPYPFKELCGAAVAFKLAHALLRRAAIPSSDCRAVDARTLDTRIVPSFLKLVAIATVADAVPLTGENRVLTSLGLRELRDPRSAGLRALMEIAGALRDDGSEPTATEIAFRIAPRINAAGRMDVASDVVQLLLTREAAEGRALAEKLHRLNDERRQVEASVLEDIERQLTAAPSDASPRCLVLDGDGWHRGVVGILASRVVERTGRPAVVIGHDDGVAHGSGRSIRGYHLLDAITTAHAQSAEGLFSRFGGHAFAVGFSMPSDRVPELRNRLAMHAEASLAPELLQPSIRVDAVLPFDSITPALPRLLARLEPFGHSNPEPVFLARNVTICEEPRVLKEKHLRLRLSGTGSVRLPALCWSRGIAWPDRLRELGIGMGSRVDVLFRLRENRHPQWGGIEAEVCDMRLTAGAARERIPVQVSGTESTTARLI